MVKIISPLYSVRASGSIGQRLTFLHRQSGQTARFQRAQTDRNTAGQAAQRIFYVAAVEGWNSYTEEQKQAWREQAQSLHMSGYNLFMKTYLKILFPSAGGAIFGDCLFGNVLYGES